MADYFTHFSCLLDVGTDDKRVRALQLYAEAPNDETELGYADAFMLEPSPDTPSTLWIHDGDAGNDEAVVRFVLHLADALDLAGVWGFEYASTCSRPRLDAFGGGAWLLDLGDRSIIDSIGTHSWLTAALAEDAVDA